MLRSAHRQTYWLIHVLCLPLWMKTNSNESLQFRKLKIIFHFENKRSKLLHVYTSKSFVKYILFVACSTRVLSPSSITSCKTKSCCTAGTFKTNSISTNAYYCCHTYSCWLLKCENSISKYRGFFFTTSQYVYNVQTISTTTRCIIW